MLDYFDEYYLGGVDDMTCSSVECWTNLVSWFKNGDIGDPWELCPLTSAITRRTDSPPAAHPCIPNIVGREFSDEEKLVMHHLQAEDKDGVFKIWYTGPEWDEGAKESRHKEGESNPEASLTYYGHAAFARFGQSIAIGEFGIGNPFQLAVAAPFHSVEGHAPHVGTIDFLSMVPKDIHTASPIRLDPPLSISPQRESEMTGLRFGFDISPLTLKLSNGGWQNVTALAVGVPGWKHGGSLHIYATSADYGVHNLVLEIKPYHPAWHKSYYGKRQFASKLFVADIDGDGKDDLLILNPWTDYMGGPILPDPRADEDHDRKVGLDFEDKRDPQRGNIAVFLGRQIDMMIDHDGYVLDEDCAFWLNPPNGDGRERFGTSIAFAKKAGVLLVGEPGAGRNSSVSGHGRVYGIKVSTEEPQLVLTIDGPDQSQDTLPVEFGGGGLATGVTADGIEWIAIAAHNTVSFHGTSCSHAFRMFNSMPKPASSRFILSPTHIKTCPPTVFSTSSPSAPSNRKPLENSAPSPSPMAKTCSGSHPPGQTKKKAYSGHITSPTVLPDGTLDDLPSNSKAIASSTSLDKIMKLPKCLLMGPNLRYSTHVCILVFLGGF